MNLVIDLGNTRVKLALFDNGLMLFSDNIEILSPEYLEKFLEANPGITAAILSSVVDFPGEIKTFLTNKFKFIELNPGTSLPLENLYKTPETLGKDRIAAAVGANNRFRNQDVLVIDAGTCIKYDFVNHKNQYLGGSISPGIDMRFKALHTFTSRLPLLNDRDFNSLMGTNTRESILSGVLNGIRVEVQSFTDEYVKQYPGLKVILTGGDMDFFVKQLKNSIFADPFLILKGLNIILEENFKC